jgi:hypothetical protein
MIDGRLTLDGPVTVEAGDATDSVLAALELIDDGRALAAVAAGALTRGFDQGGRGLIAFDPRPPCIDQERGNDQRCPDDDGGEHGPEWHADDIVAIDRGFRQG